MTDDLVKRLRTQGAGEDGYRTVFNGLLNDAASALESLTAENAALKAERDEAVNYTRGLLVSFVNEHCSPIPEWKPLDDLIGMLTQLDNASTIARELKQQRNEAFERAASWHDHQAELVMNSLHCGDSVPTIAAARRKADWHTESAAAIRNLSKES